MYFPDGKETIKDIKGDSIVGKPVENNPWLFRYVEHWRWDMPVLQKPGKKSDSQ